LYPAASAELSTIKYPVSPGDNLAAQVSAAGVLPLSDFGSVKFTGSYATGDGSSASISSFANSEITMAGGGGNA